MLVRVGRMCIAALLLASQSVRAQDDVILPSALADAVWQAVTPALAYPAATDEDLPADGASAPLWIVRRLDGAGGHVAEVIANPLNRENQARAEQAMAMIQAAVTRAEREAQAEYERILSGTSQAGSRELKGVSLDDEGVAGERFDWEARLAIDASSGVARTDWRIPGPVTMATSTVAGGTAVSSDAGEYEEIAAEGRRLRYRAAETRLYFGLQPSVRVEGHDRIVSVRPDVAGHGVVVTLRGNEALLTELLTTGDWTRVGALVQK